MDVLVFRTQSAPRLEHIPNELDSMQGIVGGYIEPICLDDDLILVCNEEGRLRDLPPTARCAAGDIAGPCFVVKNGDEDFVGLTAEDVLSALRQVRSLNPTPTT